jgi:CheY-like chemotaxis protein
MKSSPSDDTRRKPAKGPLRILVVEDHADTRQGIALFLGVLGHQARFAQGLHEALGLAAVEEEPFDLLLCDLQLPDGDGWEFLRCLREGKPRAGLGHRPERLGERRGRGQEPGGRIPCAPGKTAHVASVEGSVARGHRGHPDHPAVKKVVCETP